MKTTHKTLLTLLALGATGAVAQAHPGHGPMDLVTGLSHPLLGADHLLAMVAVGLWSAQQGGRARWALPAGFVGALAVAAALGAAGHVPPAVELWIAASVALLGAVLTLALRAGLGWCLVLVASAGALHGFAHGAEMPAGASAFSYFTGFVLMSALLHAAGVLLGGGAVLSRRPVVLRCVGACVLAFGCVLIFQGAS